MNETALTAETLIQRNQEVVHSAIDGEVVMMSMEQGKYYGLNAVGSHIWNLLEKPRKVGDVCRSLMEKFEVDEAQCLDEVTTFLAGFEKQKLITVTG